MVGPAIAELPPDGSFVPAPAPGVGAVDADGEAVLVDAHRRELHLLNRTGALLWACFDGTSSLAEICADFGAAFDVPLEQALSDTSAVVADLVAAGLVYDGRVALPHGIEVEVPRRPRLLEEPPSG